VKSFFNKLKVLRTWNFSGLLHKRLIWEEKLSDLRKVISLTSVNNFKNENSVVNLFTGEYNYKAFHISSVHFSKPWFCRRSFFLFTTWLEEGLLYRKGLREEESNFFGGCEFKQHSSALPLRLLRSKKCTMAWTNSYEVKPASSLFVIAVKIGPNGKYFDMKKA